MSAIVLAAATMLSACRDNPLVVTNPNNPDVDRVYGTPRDVETIISKLFQQMWNGQHQAFGQLGTSSMLMSLESHSALANNGFGARAFIPRGPIDNSFANATANENFRDFDHLQRNTRGASNAIRAMNAFLAAGNTTGSPARDARARAFAYFALGYGLGNLALLYDSAAIINATVPSDEVPPLSERNAVMAEALASLDSAIAIAGSAAATVGTAGFPLPLDWMSSTTTVSISDFQRIARSYKARFRAGVSRTPAERAAVDWNAVVADATNGITSNLIVNASASGGWGATWQQQLAVDPTWSQMTPFILGMADTTGLYAEWLQTPLNSRVPFLLRTPDIRFPSGETREAQQLVTGSTRSGTPSGSILYFRNRPTGEDSNGYAWGNWYYDNWRFWAIRQAGGNGGFVAMAIAELDMLAAEGYLRTSRIPQAAALIDKTRVRAGLPSVAGIASLAQPVPGGSACVPMVPQPPSFTTVACGTIFEAMKWEKRVETSFTGYAQWYIDSRGWGDLVEGTALEWPVPYQELYARLNLKLYPSQLQAARGTYGF